MATAFQKFMIEFSKFRAGSELEKVQYAESRGYGWRLGTTLKAELEQHLDVEWPDAPSDVKNNFQSCFAVGNDFMGLPVVGHVGGSLARSAYLLKVTEYKASAQMPNVEFKQSVFFDSGRRVTCPVSKAPFDWICAVKLNSFQINDGHDEYVDNYGAAYMGTVVNKQFDMGMRPHSENDGVAFFGNVNYRTGELWVSRSSDKNIVLLDALLDYYFATQSGGSGDSGGGDSGGGESSGGGDDAGGGSAMPELGVEPVKHADNVSVTCTRYGPPVTLLWTYTLPDEADGK